MIANDYRVQGLYGPYTNRGMARAAAHVLFAHTQGLPSKEWFGKRNPYVLVHCGSVLVKTVTHRGERPAGGVWGIARRARA